MIITTQGGAKTQDQPAFIFEDSRGSVTISEANFGNNRYPVLVRNVRNDKTLSELMPHQIFADPKTGQRRPLDRLPAGSSWVAHDFGSTARDSFIGHPFLCDRLEASLTVAQAGPESFQIEAQNPTDQVICASLEVNLDSGVAGKASGWS